MNSVILPIQSPDLLSCFMNYFHSWFYFHTHLSIHVVEPFVLPAHLSEYFTKSCSLDICAPVFRNSITLLPFQKKITEWYLFLFILLVLVCFWMLINFFLILIYIKFLITQYVVSLENCYQILIVSQWFMIIRAIYNWSVLDTVWVL